MTADSAADDGESILIRASYAAWEETATGRDHTLLRVRIAAAITDPAAARRAEPGTWKR